MKKAAFKICYGHIALAAALLLLTTMSRAQNSRTAAPSSKIDFGFRVGLNYAKVSGSADSMQYQYKQGLMIAVFLNPHYKGIIGSRHEFLYSRQGFRYTDSKGHSGTMSNDYLMVPQMMTINITKFVQLQIGIFAGYLLRSQDSNDSSRTTSSDYSAYYLNLMNRIDYGAAGGIEIHPFKGLTLNARYNMGFAKMYKKQNSSAATPYNPSMYFMPYQNIDTKNAVVQFSVGYLF